MRTKLLLYVIFSFNRLAYIKNLHASLKRFAPNADMLIIDDGSTEQELLTWLKLISSHNVEVIFLPEKVGNENLIHGRLWANKNLALTYAIKKKYNFACFLDDDMQMMWENTELIPTLIEMFRENENCVQIDTTFYKKLSFHSYRSRLEYIPGKNYAWLRPYGLADTGYINLDRARKLDLKFGLAQEGQYYSNSNTPLKRLIAHIPNIGFIPWPKTIQFNSKSSDILRFAEAPAKGINGLFLSDIDVELVEKLKDPSRTEPAFLEDFVRLEKWGAIQPYWYTKTTFRSLSKAYFSYLFYHKQKTPKYVKDGIPKPSIYVIFLYFLILNFPVVAIYETLIRKPLISMLTSMRDVYRYAVKDR